MKESYITYHSIWFWLKKLIRDVFCKQRTSTLSGILLRAVAVIFIALVIGGTNVSKLQLLGPLYFIDFVFVTLTLVVIWHSAFKFIWALYFFSFALVGLYLGLSFFRSDAPIEIVLRQFSLFIYMFSSYVIVGYLLKYSKKNEIVGILIGVAALSVACQVLYLVVLTLSGSFDIGGFYYLSPLVVCGTIVWACYAFSVRGVCLSTILIWLLLVFLSISFGHSSAVMAVGLTPFLYFILKTSLKYRLYTLAIVISLLLLIFFAFPAIVDVNASWRIIYWYDAFSRITSGINWLFGLGFGQMYANDLTHEMFLGIFDSSNDLDTENEGYYKAFHNSYITIIFHVGLVGLIFIAPLFRAAVMTARFYECKENLFYALSIISLGVWAFFNVVLELPHSAHYYWFLVFVCVDSQKRVLEINYPSEVICSGEVVKASKPLQE